MIMGIDLLLYKGSSNVALFSCQTELDKETLILLTDPEENVNCVHMLISPYISGRKLKGEVYL